MNLMSFTLDEATIAAIDQLVRDYDYPIHRTAVIRRALKEFLDSKLGPNWPAQFTSTTPAAAEEVES